MTIEDVNFLARIFEVGGNIISIILSALYISPFLRTIVFVASVTSLSLTLYDLSHIHRTMLSWPTAALFCSILYILVSSFIFFNPMGIQSSSLAVVAVLTAIIYFLDCIANLIAIYHLQSQIEDKLYTHGKDQDTRSASIPSGRGFNQPQQLNPSTSAISLVSQKKPISKTSTVPEPTSGICRCNRPQKLNPSPSAISLVSQKKPISKTSTVPEPTSGICRCNRPQKLNPSLSEISLVSQKKPISKASTVPKPTSAICRCKHKKIEHELVLQSVQLTKTPHSVISKSTSTEFYPIEVKSTQNEAINPTDIELSPIEATNDCCRCKKPKKQVIELIVHDSDDEADVKVYHKQEVDEKLTIVEPESNTTDTSAETVLQPSIISSTYACYDFLPSYKQPRTCRHFSAPPLRRFPRQKGVSSLADQLNSNTNK